MEWDNIARTGKYQDSNGRWHTFTPDDFDQVVKNFEPGTVPLVLGHPKTDSPAYGWVSELRRDGEWLQAKYSDLSDQLVEMLKRKLYKYKSMALNGLKLRHVGLLGAANPAIPGLGPVHFNSAEDICCFEFNESPAMAPDGGNKMNIEELMAKIASLEAQIKELVAAKEQVEASQKEAECKKEAVEKEFAAYREEVVNAKRKARIDALVSSGRLSPGSAAAVLSYAKALALTEDTMDFAAADGKVDKISIEEHYLRSLEQADVNALFSSLQAPEVSNQSASKPMDARKL